MSADTPLSWQAIAIELLRRRAGAPPGIPTEQLQKQGLLHENELLERGIDSLLFLECGIDHPRQRLYDLIWSFQISEAKALLESLQRLDVHPVLFKGMESGQRYDVHAVGYRHDVDLLFYPAENIWWAQKVLWARDYVPGTYDVRTHKWKLFGYKQSAQQALNAYEFVPFCRSFKVEQLDPEVIAEVRAMDARGEFVPNDDEPWGTLPLACMHDDTVLLFVAFDLHHNVLFNLNLEPFLKRTITSALGIGKALSPTDHLWFAIHRYYMQLATSRNDIPGLQMLSTIAAMVRDPHIDWDLLVQNAADSKATSPCFYWLTFFRQLGVSNIPDSTLAKLRSMNRMSTRNWGYQLGRFFEMEERFPSELFTMS